MGEILPASLTHCWPAAGMLVCCSSSCWQAHTSFKFPSSVCFEKSLQFLPFIHFSAYSFKAQNPYSKLIEGSLKLVLAQCGNEEQRTSFLGKASSDSLWDHLQASFSMNSPRKYWKEHVIVFVFINICDVSPDFYFGSLMCAYLAENNF